MRCERASVGVAFCSSQTLTLIEGLIASLSFSALLLCRIIFHAPYSRLIVPGLSCHSPSLPLASLLMLKRDGKWRLPVIYNRFSPEHKKPRRQAAEIDAAKTPTRAIALASVTFRLDNKSLGDSTNKVLAFFCRSVLGHYCSRER
jgi:hypothetical protein